MSLHDTSETRGYDKGTQQNRSSAMKHMSIRCASNYSKDSTISSMIGRPLADAHTCCLCLASAAAMLRRSTACSRRRLCWLRHSVSAQCWRLTSSQAHLSASCHLFHSPRHLASCAQRNRT